MVNATEEWPMATETTFRPAEAPTSAVESKISLRPHPHRAVWPGKSVVRSLSSGRERKCSVAELRARAGRRAAAYPVDIREEDGRPPSLEQVAERERPDGTPRSAACRRGPGQRRRSAPPGRWPSFAVVGPPLACRLRNDGSGAWNAVSRAAADAHSAPRRRLESRPRGP